MEIIETTIFTRQVIQYLSDEEYLDFQMAIVKRPDSGNLIPGSRGLRKVRWKYQGQGKSGGVRIIYYWLVDDSQLLFLYLYPKNVRDNLTHDQLKMLQKIVERELKNG